MAGLRFAVLLAASSFGALLLAASASAARPPAVFFVGDAWRAAPTSINHGAHFKEPEAWSSTPRVDVLAPSRSPVPGNQRVADAVFSDLSVGEKVRVGAICLSIAVVMAVITALVVHCCHCRRGARAHDQEAARRSDEVQQSAARLAASQARTEEVEIELAAAHEQTRLRTAQVAELDQRIRGVCEELRRERQRTCFLERKLSLTEEARALEKEAEVATRQLEELQGLLGVRAEDDEVSEPELRAPPASPETEYFSAA